MRIVQSLLRRLRSLLKKDSSNVDLSEELQFHLEHQVEANISRGMSPEEAKAAARAEFGSVAGATEASYEARGVALLDDLVQDVRYGLRTLIKHRSFTLVTILTLALGIGACTAIFSVVNAVLIRSLPYGDAGKLVYLFTPNPQLGLPAEVFGPSYADYSDLKKQSHSFSEMTLFGQGTYNLAAGDRLERVSAATVDADFFATLQSTPELGRVISTSDEQPGNNRVVVISHTLWQNMLGGRSDILGSTLRLDGTSYQIVGVMPRDFGYPHKSDLAYGNGRIDTTQLWMPSALTPQQRADREASNGYAIARLKPDVTLREAQTEMSTIMARLNLLHTPEMRGWGAYIKPFRDSAVGPVRPLMWLLMGAVGVVLLIACGNAANLLLARAATRTHELGVRATLGARRGRLLRQMLTESLMLSVAAGFVGIGLAYCFLHVLLKLDPGDIPRMLDATLDIRVMVFVIFVTVLTSVLFGILPSLAATRINLAEFLKSGGMRGIMGDRRRVRNGLAIAQVALVVVLLTGAGLLLRSYVKILSLQTGFAASTVTVNVQLNPQYESAQKRWDFFEQLLDKVKLVHGVQAAGVVDYLPLSNSESLTFFDVLGYANQKNQLVETWRVTPDYLSAMQIPLLEGRGFNDDDGPGHSPVALVNEAFAKKYLVGSNAVGHKLRMSSQDPWTTIIGVVGDVRSRSLEAAVPPQMYTPFWQRDFGDNLMGMSAFIAVRSFLPQDVVVSEVRSVVRSLDPNLAIANVHAMGALETAAAARRRFQTTLLAVFSGIAMVLAIVGVYGLLAYSVRQRTGEIGIRMALGSSRVGAMRLVLQEGLRLLGIGLLVGLAAALACMRLLSGFLYDVPAIDPLTFLMVPALLFAATFIACLIPGYRAASIDPINALRHE
ncbi:ABC transporter permease [Acidobacterium sp. S8]|uniref:ABC transporter permease n=1 Tax=Acidobacterium sp. S8 TaxID=1641854 RepID=UPI00131E7A0A|nr:ABC transporter permease [Acidobacterium sp. S8]